MATTRTTTLGRPQIRTIRQRHLTGGGAVDVADEGSGIAAKDVEQIFQRGHGSHNGIGLAFARSIAEADGGRVVLSHRHPTTFSLILLHPDRHSIHSPPAGRSEQIGDGEHGAPVPRRGQR